MAKDEQMSTPQFSIKDVVELVKTMNEENRSSMMAMVAELKKPTEFEQQKLDEAELKRKRSAQNRIDEMLSDEQARLSKQTSCAHKRRTKDGFASAWGGQVNADGYVRFVCNQCFMVAPEVKAPMEWIQSGINAQSPDNPFMYQLTLEQIQKWHDHFGAKPVTRRKGDPVAVGA